jgi:hypothetical protein
MYYGYYGYPDGHNITSDLSVILFPKLREFNPSGLIKKRIQHKLHSNGRNWFCETCAYRKLCSEYEEFESGKLPHLEMEKNLTELRQRFGQS